MHIYRQYRGGFYIALTRKFKGLSKRLQEETLQSGKKSRNILLYNYYIYIMQCPFNNIIIYCSIII